MDSRAAAPTASAWAPLRSRLTIWMSGWAPKPRSEGGGLAIRQHIDDGTSLEVEQVGAIALATSQGPNIHAEDPWELDARSSPTRTRDTTAGALVVERSAVAVSARS